MLIRARVLEYRRTFRYSREQPTATLVPDFCLSPNYISLAFLGAWWRLYSFLSLSFRSKNRPEMLSSSSLNGCRFSVFPRCLDRPRRCRSYRSSCLWGARGLCLLCLFRSRGRIVREASNPFLPHLCQCTIFFDYIRYVCIRCQERGVRPEFDTVPSLTPRRSSQI